MTRVSFTPEELGRAIQILDALLINHEALVALNPRHRVAFDKLRRKLRKAYNYSRVGFKKYMKMREVQIEKRRRSASENGND